VAPVFLLFFLTTFLALVATPIRARVNEAGGWIGVASAAMAWYASFAAPANATLERAPLPLGPRGRD